MLTIRSHVNYRPGSCRSAPLLSLAPIASRRPPTPSDPERRPRPEPSRDRAPRPAPANDDDADAVREVPLAVPFEGRGHGHGAGHDAGERDRRCPDPLDAPPVRPEHYVGSMELYEAGHARIVQQRTRERVHAPRDGRYTIYAILDPATGEAVYVGQSGDTRKRQRRHLAYWSGKLEPVRGIPISSWLATLGGSPLVRGVEAEFVEAEFVEAGLETAPPRRRSARPSKPVFRTLAHAGTLLEALEAETDWIERLGAAGHRLLNASYHREAARQAWPGGGRGLGRPAGRGEPHDREAAGGAGKGA